jgi:hypothetical protein
MYALPHENHKQRGGGQEKTPSLFNVLTRAAIPFLPTENRAPPSFNMDKIGKVKDVLHRKFKSCKRLISGSDAARQWAASLSAKDFVEYVTLRDIPSVQRLGKLNSKLMQDFVSNRQIQMAANLDVPLLTATELCK